VIIGERSHQFRELSARIRRLYWFLFVTALDTVDNVGVHVGNNKIFSDTIHNDNTNAYRRVALTAKLAHSVNPHDAMERLAARGGDPQRPRPAGAFGGDPHLHRARRGAGGAAVLPQRTWAVVLGWLMRE
jgi:hypothetical protein